MLGIPADDILRISAKTGEGVPELLDAVVERMPAPQGDADAPLQALIFDSHFDQYRGVVELGAGHERHADHRRPPAVHAGRTRSTTPTRSACARPTPTPVASLGPGEVGYLIAGIKDVGEARSGETVTEAARPAEAARGLPRPEADGVLRPLPGRRRRLRRPARGAREAPAQRLAASPTSRRRRARSASASAAGSSACCTWRSSASASSASSTSASSPPRRRWSTSCTPRRAPRWRSTTRATCRPCRRSSTSRSRSSPSRSSRPSTYTGTLMELCQKRRGEHAEAGVPLARAGRARLPHAAGRGRHRLLRPAEEPHAGLRQPRLRAGRLRPRRPREGRRPAQRRAGRRVQHDRAPRQGRTTTAGA